MQRKFKFEHYIEFYKIEHGAHDNIEKKYHHCYAYADIREVNHISAPQINNIDFGNVTFANLYLFQIRHIPGLKQDMRINFDHKAYEIKTIINNRDRANILKILAQQI